MEKRKSVRSAVADRAGRYRVSVEVVRSDWVAEWYRDQALRFIELQGLEIQELTEAEALRMLFEVARALGRAGYAVDWNGGEGRSFVYNGGGVRVVVEERE